MPLAQTDTAIDEYIINRYHHHPLIWLCLTIIALISLFIAPWVLIFLCLWAIKEIRYQVEITTHKISYRHGTFYTKSTHIGIRDLICIEMRTYGIPFIAEMGTIVLRTKEGKRHTFMLVPNPEEKVRLIDHLSGSQRLATSSKSIVNLRRFSHEVKELIN